MIAVAAAGSFVDIGVEESIVEEPADHPNSLFRRNMETVLENYVSHDKSLVSFDVVEIVSIAEDRLVAVLGCTVASMEKQLASAD